MAHRIVTRHWDFKIANYRGYKSTFGTFVLVISRQSGHMQGSLHSLGVLGGILRNIMSVPVPADNGSIQ